MTAYDITDRQIQGGPGWIDTVGFDLDAKAEAPSTRSELLLMLRTMLADRFGLTLHRELKELSVEALLPATPDPNLKPAVDSTANPAVIIHDSNQHSLTVVGRNVTLPFVARYVSARLHRLVVDRTGLAGAFDFTVELPLDQQDVQDLNLAETDVMAHVFGDLISHLGLKLQSLKSQVEIFTIENVEPPAAN